MSETGRRLLLGFLLVALVLAIGTVGFHLIGMWHGRDWPWFDCLYMTVITVSTVGYGEVLPIESVPYARIFAMTIIVFGMGILVYFASAVVTAVVEMNVQEVLRRRAVRKTVEEMSDHVIVCGVGTTGIHVVEELLATKVPFVVIDNDAERLAWIEAHLAAKVLSIVGDATEDETLQEAGIARAKGVVSALSSDKDNLFVTITARQLNSKVRIVSRAREATSATKLRRAGADAIVSPNLIGGLRMVSEMIRPKVVEFLDLMLRDKDRNLRIEEVGVGPGSPVAGKRLAEANIRKHTKLLVVAARSPDGKHVYNPAPDFVLAEGTTLIVLGETEDVVKLRQWLKQTDFG